MIIQGLKQRVTAKSQRIKRYESRVGQYDQNRFFEINWRRSFEHLEGTERGENELPVAKASRYFWKGIWDKDVKHNEEADRIKTVEREVSKTTEKQVDFSVPMERLRKQAIKLLHWKSPGPDGVQGYWVKNIKGQLFK